MADNNLYSHFKKQFDRRPDAPLLVTGEDVEYSNRDIDEYSARLAGFLTSCGLAPGDRVSVQVEKSPAALCLYLACLRGGFVFHPLNPAYTDDELEYFIDNAEPAMVVCDPDRQAIFEKLAESNACQVLTLDKDGGGMLTERSADCAPLGGPSHTSQSRLILYRAIRR